MKQMRMAKAKKMSRLIAAGRLEKVVFTDEKIFTVQPIQNRQNHRQLPKRALKNTFAGPTTFSEVRYSGSRHMCPMQDGSCVHRSKCENQR